MTKKKAVKIPKDDFRSGTADYACGATLYGATMEELQKKIAAYMRNYHPTGYNTHISQPIALHPDGYYWCRLSRYHSCD